MTVPSTSSPTAPRRWRRIVTPSPLGDWIFVTGQIATGRDGDPIPESIEEQTHKVMANLKTVLAGCGAGLEHAVSVRIFLTRFEEEYDAMNAVYETYLLQRTSAPPVPPWVSRRWPGAAGWRST